MKRRYHTLAVLFIILIFSFPSVYSQNYDASSSLNDISTLAPESVFNIRSDLRLQLTQSTQFPHGTLTKLTGTTYNAFFYQKGQNQNKASWRGVDHPTAIVSALISKEFLVGTFQNILRDELDKLLGRYRTGNLYQDLTRLITEVVIEQTGSKGSQKEVYRIFVRMRSGYQFQFACKITINKAAEEGFRQEEIRTLRSLSSKGLTPRFGEFYEGNINGATFQLYSEEFIQGKTIAQIKKHPWLDLNGLTKIIATWTAITKQLGQRPNGKYNFPDDIQPPNMMVFMSYNNNEILGNPVAVDVGLIRPHNPVEILDKFFKYYGSILSGNSQREVAYAIFRGVIEAMGSIQGEKFLINAYNSAKNNINKPTYLSDLQTYIANSMILSPLVAVDDNVQEEIEDAA